MKRACMLMTGLAIAGCAGGEDSARPPDGASSPDLVPGPDIAPPLCAVPMASPDPIVVGGGAFDGTTKTALAGVSVTLKRLADDTAVGQTTTAADGTWSATIATGGKPFVGYIAFSLAGHLTSYRQRKAGWHGNTPGVNVPLFTAAAMTALATAAGASWNPANGVVAANVTTCEFTRAIQGATLQFVPGSPTPVYADDNNVPTAGLAQTGHSGAAWDFAVPPGDITAYFTSNGSTSAYAGRSRAGGYTELVLFP